MKKIIVIGAGIAGLAACEKLNELGFDATILEARNRVGGRILTDTSLGIPIGKGAAWIHGDQNNPMTEFAKYFHVQMDAIDAEKCIVFDSQGSPIASSDRKKFSATFDTLTKEAREFAYRCEHDISLSTALKHLLQAKNISSLEKILLKSKLYGLEGYMGANYTDLSARTYDDAEIWPGDQCFLTGSYQAIIDGLAKKCRVHLNTIVKEINLREKNVEIITQDSRFHADAVIVTLPLGVLQKDTVRFNPSLPQNKLNAIQSLGMGLFNITAMKFPKLFWPHESHALLFTEFDNPSISVFFNLSHLMQQPILLGYSGGQTAVELEKLSDEEHIKKIMDNFKKHFGAALPDPDSFFITRWSEDPYSYGSYSYFKTGSTCKDYDTVAEPIFDKVFFAGEATCSRYPATTHGAYLSGIREAERICRVLK